jgi:hypothetical protein
MKFAIGECENCYNNPQFFEAESQYWQEDGIKFAASVFLHRKPDEYNSLCWKCFREKLDQDTAEWEEEYRNRVYREMRRDMLEEKDNWDRAARMTKELRNRFKAEA